MAPLACVLLLAIQALAHFSSPIFRDSLGSARIGDPGPGGVAISMPSGKKFKPKQQKGKFVLFVVHPGLPSSCLDQDCGPEMKSLLQRGGRVYGGSDLKWLSSYFPTSPKLESGIAMRLSPQGKIEKIAEGIAIGDLKALIP